MIIEEEQRKQGNKITKKLSMKVNDFKNDVLRLEVSLVLVSGLLCMLVWQQWRTLQVESSFCAVMRGKKKYCEFMKRCNAINC